MLRRLKWPLLIAAWLLLIVGLARAQEHHDRHHSVYQNWVNQEGRGCCNNQDCGELADENQRSTPTGLEVKVEGQWCPVLPKHYLRQGNAANWETAHVCVRHPYSGEEASSPCERLLCYQPKPLS